MIRTDFKIRIFFSGMLMLTSLTALAQSAADTDGSELGADPGLPAEAPMPQAPSPRANRSSSAGSGVTLPAPAPDALVQPYESPSAPSIPLTSSPKSRPPITGKLAELNLTAEQAQQIIELRRQWRPEVEKRLKDEFSALKQNLAQAMADNSQAEEVRRRFELMQKKYLELQSVKFEKLLRIREVLTPEQRKKFAGLRSKAGKNNDSE